MEVGNIDISVPCKKPQLSCLPTIPRRKVSVVHERPRLSDARQYSALIWAVRESSSLAAAVWHQNRRRTAIKRHFSFTTSIALRGKLIRRLKPVFVGSTSDKPTVLIKETSAGDRRRSEWRSHHRRVGRGTSRPAQQHTRIASCCATLPALLVSRPLAGSSVPPGADFSFQSGSGRERAAWLVSSRSFKRLRARVDRNTYFLRD